MPETPEVHHTPTPEHASKIGSFLNQSTAGLPNWAWLLVIGAGIAAAVVIPKFLNKGTTSNTTPNATGTTDTSASGLGLAVDPTTGLPYAVEGLVPSGGFAGASNTTLPPLPSAPPAPTPQPTTYSIRQEIASGPGAGTPSPDIPVRNSPGGSVIGAIPFGTTVQVTGTPIEGPNNFGPNTPSGTGSTLWYPVSGGYVSAFDIKTSGTGSTGPRWPTSYLRSRHKNIGVA